MRGETKCAMGKMNVHEVIVMLGTLPVSRLHVEKQVEQKKEQQQKELFYYHNCYPFDRIFELHYLRTSCALRTAKVLLHNSALKFPANMPHCTLVHKSSLCT